MKDYNVALRDIKRATTFHPNIGIPWRESPYCSRKDDSNCGNNEQNPHLRNLQGVWVSLLKVTTFAWLKFILVQRCWYRCVLLTNRRFERVFRVPTLKRRSTYQRQDEGLSASICIHWLRLVRDSTQLCNEKPSILKYTRLTRYLIYFHITLLWHSRELYH